MRVRPCVPPFLPTYYRAAPPIPSAGRSSLRVPSRPSWRGRQAGRQGFEPLGQGRAGQNRAGQAGRGETEAWHTHALRRPQETASQPPTPFFLALHVPLPRPTTVVRPPAGTAYRGPNPETRAAPSFSGMLSCPPPPPWCRPASLPGHRAKQGLRGRRAPISTTRHLPPNTRASPSPVMPPRTWRDDAAVDGEGARPRAGPWRGRGGEGKE